MPTILVVDDVPENLRVLGELLRLQDYRVQLATSGTLALRHAAQTPGPDLILLDLMMPGMDGYEVLRQLKANAGTCDIPVMILSALGEARDEELGFELGAADYIGKPFHSATVLARVRTQLAASQARRGAVGAQVLEAIRDLADTLADASGEPCTAATAAKLLARALPAGADDEATRRALEPCVLALMRLAAGGRDPGGH